MDLGVEVGIRVRDGGGGMRWGIVMVLDRDADIDVAIAWYGLSDWRRGEEGKVGGGRRGEDGGENVLLCGFDVGAGAGAALL